MGWLDKYQQGGVVENNSDKLGLADTPEYKGVKDFYYNYLKSDKYLERLNKQLYDNPKEIRNKRLNNLLNTKVTLKEGADSNAKNKGEIVLGKEDINEFGLNTLLAHEWAHKLGAGENVGFFDKNDKWGNDFKLNINDQEVLAVFNSLKSKKPLLDQTSQELHDSSNYEFKADLDTFRYLLNKNKIHDSQSDIDSSIFKKLPKNIKNNKIYKRLRDKVKDDDSLIYLMNNIALNNSNTNQNNIAKNGTWMDKYQQGGSIKRKDERYAAIKKSSSPDYKTERQLEELKNIKEDLETVKKDRTISNPKSSAIKKQLSLQKEKQGELKQHVPQSVASKTWEVATNPITAFGYAARNQDLPDNFSRGERNLQDDALDLVNPAFYLNEAGEFVGNVATGHPIDASMNALNILPLASEAKAIGRIGNKALTSAERAYDTTRGGLRNLMELNVHNPSSVYHNVVRRPINKDKTSSSLFRRAFEKDLDPKEATQAINKKVDDIISDLGPGQQLREKSLSADSFRLLMHKAGALKDDFKVIPTKAYQPLNNLSNLRKELFDKYANMDEFVRLENEGASINKLKKESLDKVNEDIVGKLTAYTQRLSKQLGQDIPPPKIIAGQVHIPQIIFERGGGNILQEIKRHTALAKPLSISAGVAGLTDIGLDAAFDNYDSEFSKIIERQKAERNKPRKSEPVPKKYEKGGWLDSYEHGGDIIEDDRGQWAHPGKITKINSNKITMKGVTEDLIGVSDEGDIQYMTPNKNYKFKGKSVTEYPIDKLPNWLDKYQNGGIVKEKDVIPSIREIKLPETPVYPSSTEKVKSFYNDYLNSDKYKEKLIKSNYKDPDKVVQKRLKNLKDTKVVFQDKEPNFFEQLYNKSYGIPDTVVGSKYIHNPDKPTIVIDNDQIKAISRRIPRYDYDQLEDVIAHEQAHGFSKTVPLPKSVEKEITKRITGKKYNIHDESASEIYSDMEALKYNLYKNKIYNPLKEDFTEDHIEKQQTGDDVESSYIMDRLLRLIDIKDFIWLMNNVASNTDLQDVNKSINFTNNNWLDKYNT